MRNGTFFRHEYSSHCSGTFFSHQVLEQWEQSRSVLMMYYYLIQEHFKHLNYPFKNGTLVSEGEQRVRRPSLWIAFVLNANRNSNDRAREGEREPDLKPEHARLTAPFISTCYLIFKGSFFINNFVVIIISAGGVSLRRKYAVVFFFFYHTLLHKEGQGLWGGGGGSVVTPWASFLIETLKFSRARDGMFQINSLVLTFFLLHMAFHLILKGRSSLIFISPVVFFPTAQAEIWTSLTC